VSFEIAARMSDLVGAEVFFAAIVTSPDGWIAGRWPRGKSKRAEK